MQDSSFSYSKIRNIHITLMGNKLKRYNQHIHIKAQYILYAYSALMIRIYMKHDFLYACLWELLSL